MSLGVSFLWFRPAITFDLTLQNRGAEVFGSMLESVQFLVVKLKWKHENLLKFN
ncbi:hypothetical protein Hanom_Chr11g01038891 [Helianthus anomalus]